MEKWNAEYYNVPSLFFEKVGDKKKCVHILIHLSFKIGFRCLTKIATEYAQEKNYNHKLQTNPWHHEEEPHNNQETPGRQTKQSNQLSLPHQDNWETRMDIK